MTAMDAELLDNGHKFSAVLELEVLAEKLGNVM
jgi:hypothetical protein